ncbi:MAG: hypothetical protein CMH31_06530 [Micavibrio sp.]|nr:hypothetical protein [Micavibrio sp.]
MFWKKKEPKKDKKPSREEILAQAKANASAAREEIGDDTLDKIREALLKKENSPFAQAKKRIEAMDHDKVRDNVSLWMREDDKE